jgi:hypothetical protein
MAEIKTKLNTKSAQNLTQAINEMNIKITFNFDNCLLILFTIYLGYVNKYVSCN